MKPLKESFIKAKDLDKIKQFYEIEPKDISFDEIKCGDLIVTISIESSSEFLRIVIDKDLAKKFNIATNYDDLYAVRYDKSTKKFQYIKLSSFKDRWPNSKYFCAVKYYKTNINPNEKFKNKEDLIEWLKTYENKLNIK